MSISLALGGCAAELGQRVPAREGPATAISLPGTAGISHRVLPPEDSDRDVDPVRPRDHRRARRGPSNARFIAAHLGTGVAGTLIVQSAIYALTNHIGHSGRGLSPVIGALVVGAFAPPILNYALQWAVGNAIAPRRDRFWPGFLVRQVAHLGIFAGALLGGADFNNPAHMTAIVFGEALANSGLATMTAELTRRPQSSLGATGFLAPPNNFGPGTNPRPRRLSFDIIVPVLEFEF